MINPQFSLNFTLPSSLQRSCFLLPDQVDWDDWGSYDRTHVVYLDILPVSCSGISSARSGRVDHFKVTATLCARL